MIHVVNLVVVVLLCFLVFLLVGYVVSPEAAIVVTATLAGTCGVFYHKLLEVENAG